jgi:signal transduction histidine kinase
MFRSLLGRLLILLVLLGVAAAGVGALMVGLFRQSATAQAGQAEAEIGRACDAITSAYRFYTAGWQEPSSDSSAAGLRRDLGAVVQTALRDRAGIEGGIWQDDTGSLAYAFPTYQGSGPKTDVPQAELDRIRSVNQVALTDDRASVSRFDASSQILLLTACPLHGPVPRLTAWTMTRVQTIGGRSYLQLMAGLGTLLLTVLAGTALLSHLTMNWSRHVGRIEKALAAYDIADLPTLPVTGERELDRVVAALNEAGQRLSAARQRASQLAREVAAGQRLAAIGRVTAGVAHEIRNPIAAMKLKAESALAADGVRKDEALSAILGQIERLDGLLRRLLSVTERDRPDIVPVRLVPFLASCIARHREPAGARNVKLSAHAEEETCEFDPEQIGRAIDNLVLNALQAAPRDTAVVVTARRDGQNLLFGVHDEGAGPPAALRESLFEPFVTGRPDGTGLGLSIVREIAAAHGGTARLSDTGPGTTFEIVLPCQPS